MIRGVMLAVVVVAASVAGTGVASADGNEPPLAAAGLDQTVSEGTVVYLDAGGSTDPDGTIEDYRWEITAPNGSTLSPACGSCARTHFRANQSGEYTVTVTVTDDDGATASDTLYVTAETSKSPSVTVTGPATVQNGTTASFDATVTAGDSNLDRLVWLVDGTVVEREPLSGTEAERELNTSIDTAGSRTVRARAIDVNGASDADTHTVYTVTNNSSSGPSSSGPGGDTVTSMVDRIGNGGSYYMFLNGDGSFNAGSNSDANLSQAEVQRLADNTGVSYGEVNINTGPTNALVIDNPRIKEKLDKDMGKKGWGITGELEHTNTNGDYDHQPTWEQSSPGANWKRTDKRVARTHVRSEPVSKDDWELKRTFTESTGDIYTSHTKHGPYDKRTGTSTKTSSSWKSSPYGGEVVDTRESFSHYSYTVTRTDRERVRVGKEKVGTEKVYGFKTVKETKTECRNSFTSPITGTTVCTDRVEKVFTSYEWGVVDTQPVYEPVYDWQTTETTVHKTSTSYPYNGDDVQSHYDTEYKIQTTEAIPVWEERLKKWEYNEYEYRWIYDR
jgi:hypothetical protein